MKNCMGVVEIGLFSLWVCIFLFYVLGRVVYLECFELVCVFFLGGVFWYVVEENWWLGSFWYFIRVLFVLCYDVIEVDFGYLVLVFVFRLEEFCI